MESPATSKFGSQEEIIYLDWNNAIEILEKAHKTGLFVLIIGPKGTGKTTLVRKFAFGMKKDLDSVNFSLRTRESHLVGSRTLDKGEISFVEGVLVKSMRSGTILYLDELNAAEADVLQRRSARRDTVLSRCASTSPARLRRSLSRPCQGSWSPPGATPLSGGKS